MVNEYILRKSSKITASPEEFEIETRKRRGAFPGIKRHIFTSMGAHDVEVYYVNMFGSTLMGIATTESDLDIEIVLGDGEKNWNKATQYIPTLKSEIDAQHPFPTQL